MSDTVIRVEQLGKMYRIGAARQRGGGLRHALEAGLQGIGRRLLGRANPTPKEQDFWALRDVSFEIGRGECVGVIGRNGAGKSTLLKLLSRITDPTLGEIGLKGRVGSLLEVGTGFHPELTGRENITLNGAVLGMRRSEVVRKFDDIVAFAEIEKFIDTPVKFYSSGMYTRLAFAVAAHLEPEILIVDEVLAVGDAAFQKKCLGKMGEVAKGGRTVLFVSHSMQAISQLTQSTILLEKGRLKFSGPTHEGVALYSASVFAEGGLGEPYRAEARPGQVHLTMIRVATSGEFGEHVCTMPIEFEFEVFVGMHLESICFSFQILDEISRPVCHFWLLDRGKDFDVGLGQYRVSCRIPRFRLYQGRYTLKTYLSDRRGHQNLESLSEVAPFEVTMRGIDREEYEWRAGDMVYFEDCQWTSVGKRS